VIGFYNFFLNVSIKVKRSSGRCNSNIQKTYSSNGNKMTENRRVNWLDFGKKKYKNDLLFHFGAPLFYLT